MLLPLCAVMGMLIADPEVLPPLFLIVPLLMMLIEPRLLLSAMLPSARKSIVPLLVRTALFIR